MDVKLETALESAYELIEANRIDEAKVLLEPLLAEYPNELDLWWMYAHAVDSPQDASLALEHIVAIDANFANASQLLDEVRRFKDSPTPVPASSTSGVQKPVLKSLKPKPVNAPTTSPALRTEDDFDSSFEEDDELLEDEKNTSSNWIWITLLTSLLVVIGVVTIFFSLRNQSESNGIDIGLVQTATEIVIATETSFDALAAPTESLLIETEAPTETISPTETSTPQVPTETSTPTVTPTVEVVDDSEIALVALSEFELNNEPTTTQETALGETLLVTVCVPSTEQRDSTLIAAMRALASAEWQTANVDAVGIRLYDCEREIAGRAIAVTLENVNGYSNGDLDDDAYQLSWQAVG